MFRYEKMQKGRYRQFHQIGAEIFGEQHPAVDAEIIAVGYSYLQRVKCKNLLLEINSVGCRKCRLAYNSELDDFLKMNIDNLCDDCKDRLRRNPLRILDCKNSSCIEIVKRAPIILDYLCEECKVHFDDVKFYLSRYGVPYELNPYLVRGLDYYTKTAFEIKSGELGAQNSVLGGGRYDGLVKELEGPDVCGIGFALGMERLILSIDNSVVKKEVLDYYIICLIEDAVLFAIELSEEIRKRGKSCEVAYQPTSIRSAMRTANKLDAAKVIIIGEDEIKKDSLSLKDMISGEQLTISKIEFIEKLI